MIDKKIVIIVTVIIMSILTILLIIEILKKKKKNASNDQNDVVFNNQETMYSDYSSAQYEPTPMPEPEPASYSSVANDTFTVPIVPGGTGGTTLPSTDELINQANAGTLNDLGTNNFDYSMDMNNLNTPGIDLNNGLSDLTNMPPVIDDGSMNNTYSDGANNLDPLASNMPPVINDGSMNNMNLENNESTFGSPLDAPPIIEDSSNTLEENLELDKNNNLDLNLDKDSDVPDDGFY